MPDDPKELELAEQEFRESQKKLSEMDQELQESIAGASPEALIEFGQRVGGADARTALAKVMCPEHIAGLIAGSRTIAPLYTGPSLEMTEEELAQVAREQESVLPTYQRTPRAFIPRDVVVGDFWWFPLEEYLRHPLRDTFRTIQGVPLRGRVIPIREIEVAAFVSAIHQARDLAPKWAEVLVFSSEPREGPSWSRTTRIAVSWQKTTVVSYALVTTKQEIPGSPVLPPWLDELCSTLGVRHDPG